MNDAISRQGAIDALDKLCDRECVYSKKQRSVMCGACPLGSAFDVIQELPPAQPEPCGDVVSRNAIVQKLNKMDRYVSAELRLCDTDKKFPQNEVYIVDDVYEEIVEQLPSAQPERKKGRWNWHEDEDICNCSKCDFELDAEGCVDPYEYVKIYKFCPNCGARMDGGEQEGAIHSDI